MDGCLSIFLVWRDTEEGKEVVTRCRYAIKPRDLMVLNLGDFLVLNLGEFFCLQ